MKKSTKWLIGGVLGLSAYALFRDSPASGAPKKKKLASLPPEILSTFVSQGGSGDDVTWVSVPDGFAATTPRLSVMGAAFVQFVAQALAAKRRVFLSPAPVYDDGAGKRAWSLYIDAPPAGTFGAFDEVVLS